MRSCDEATTNADHRCRVDLIGLPRLEGHAVLVLHTEGTDSRLPLLSVHTVLSHEIKNVSLGIVEVISVGLVDHALKEGHAEFI